MTWAFDPGDPLKKPVEILEWLQKAPAAAPHCVLCRAAMTTRSVRTERTAHFLHLSGSHCPSIKAAGEPYRYLRNLPKQSGASHHTRDFVKANLHGVFSRMRSFAQGLVWTELEDACRRAEQLGIWDLVGLSPEYAPYVLLTCMDNFPAGRFRKRSVRFFLEPNPQPGEFWMFPSGRKRTLWEIDVVSGKQTQHAVDLRLATGDVIERNQALLS